MTDGSSVYVSQELLKPARQAFYGISAAKGAYEMKDILRPILELLVVLPGLLLGYFPVKTYLKQSPGRLAAWLFPCMALPVHRQRACLLSASCFHGLCPCGGRAGCDLPVYQNAYHLPLEIRHDCAVRLRGVRVREQPVPCRQRRDHPESAAAAGRTVALPGRLLVL